jgi:hypothetical protein
MQNQARMAHRGGAFQKMEGFDRPHHGASFRTSETAPVQ